MPRLAARALAGCGGADPAWVRNYACAWGPSGIRGNAILPGPIKTDCARAPWENDKAREAMAPLGRLGEAEESGASAAFLASKAAKFISGQTISADGEVTSVRRRTRPDAPTWRR